MSEEELEIQTKRQMFIQDQIGAVSLAVKQGIELGKQEGIEIGKQERDLEIARNMLAQGLDVALVTQITALPIEQIEKLRH
jgi:predicted transposase/invertase (TIGR01784 family)